MFENVFQRCEYKYILNEHQLSLLLTKLKVMIEEDNYSRQFICNLYYDTSNYSIIRNCIDSHGFKEKLRLRSYGVLSEGQKAYLEIKKK